MVKGQDAFEEILRPQHFRFYLKDNKPFVQTKDLMRNTEDNIPPHRALTSTITFIIDATT